MKVSKDFRLIVIGFLLILSLAFMIYPFVTRKSGVVVISIFPNSSCKEVLLPGSIITEINQKNIKDTNDFYSIVNDLEGRVNFMINGGPRVCQTVSGEKIDVKVMELQKKGIKFGIDIKGGKELILESKNVSESISVLEKRVKTYDLKNTKSEKISDNSFSIIVDLDDEYKIESLLSPGIVSVKFLKTIEIRNNTGKFTLNDKSYNVRAIDDGIEVDGKNHKIGEEFLLDEINVKIENVTQNYTSFFLDVFTDKDVEKVLLNDQNSRVFQNQGRYVYVLNILISEDAGKIFARITKDQPVIVNPTGENYLQDPLVVFMDDEIVTSVPIPKSEAGKEIQQMAIWGVENRREDAERKWLMLSGFLESGRLPDVGITERKDVKPERENLLNLTIYFVVGVVVVSCVYGFVRFEDVKVVGVILCVVISEILIFLGVISSQAFAIILGLSSVVIAAAKGEVHGWMKLSTVLLMFLILFGAVVGRLVVDSYTLFGLMFGFTVSLIYLILFSESLVGKFMKYEKLVDYIWKIGFVIVVLSTIIFFLQDYKNFAIASTVVLLASLTLTKPEYVRLVKKLKKD